MADSQFKMPSLQKRLLPIKIGDALTAIRFTLEFTLATNVADVR
jgi:hypothetical protein